MTRKLKPPPYPRPVPEIPTEEICLRPVDVLYYKTYNDVRAADERKDDDYHDAENDEIRSAKRRRIEANAHAYLRGQSLSIMSAKLKGPFDKGWRNPWSQRHSTEHSRFENAVTASKKKSLRDDRLLDVKASGQARSISRQGVCGTEYLASEDDGPGQNGVVKATMDTLRQESDEEEKTRIVKWLRTNEDYVRQVKGLPPQSSPTPIARDPNAVQVHRSFEDNCESQDVGKVNLVKNFERVQQLSRDFNSVVEYPVKHDIVPSSAGTGQKQGQFARIPDAQQNLSEEKGQKADAKATPVSSAVAQEDRDVRVDDDSKIPSSEPEGDVLVKLVDTSEPSFPPLPTEDDGRRGISAIASELNTNEQLPSAQKLPTLPRSVSSGLLEIQMIEAQPSMDDMNELSQFVEAPTRISRHDTIVSKGRMDLEQGSEENPLRREIGEGDLSVRQPRISFADPDATTGKVFAAEQTQTKQLEKKRKKASFAADLSAPKTSQTSLRQTMNAKVGKRIDKPVLFSSKKVDVDDERSTRNEAVIIDIASFSCTDSQSSTFKPTKSILKSSNSINSQMQTKSSRPTLSAIQQQDGHTDKMLSEDGQNVLLDDGNFDLEAAIDDLGSFLGSWNAEKEASGIAE